MGGLCSICMIDESLLRGRRKYKRAVFFGKTNFHWRGGIMAERLWDHVFGMVLRRDDGTHDLRMFDVLRRNRDTLRPIVLRNLAPGLFFTL